MLLRRSNRSDISTSAKMTGWNQQHSTTGRGVQGSIRKMMLPHTNQLQLGPNLLNLILRKFIPSIVTGNIRRSRVDGSRSNVLWFLLYRLTGGAC